MPVILSMFFFALLFPASAHSQGLEKALIAHTSESISLLREAAKELAMKG